MVTSFTANSVILFFTAGDKENPLIADGVWLCTLLTPWLVVFNVLYRDTMSSLFPRFATRKNASRVSLLYQRYLGLRGKWYGWKVLLIQLMTVVVQATKLKLIAATTTLYGSGTMGTMLKSSYWIFLGSLVCNSIYPAVLLNCSST